MLSGVTYDRDLRESLSYLNSVRSTKGGPTSENSVTAKSVLASSPLWCVSNTRSTQSTPAMNAAANGSLSSALGLQSVSFAERNTKRQRGIIAKASSQKNEPTAITIGDPAAAGCSSRSTAFRRHTKQRQQRVVLRTVTGVSTLERCGPILTRTCSCKLEHRLNRHSNVIG